MEKTPTFEEVRHAVFMWEVRATELTSEVAELHARIADLEAALENEEPDWSKLSLADCQLALLEGHLRKHGGRRDLAAASIGISERTFYRWVGSIGGAEALLEASA